MSRKIRFSYGLANKIYNEREYSKGNLNNLALFRPEDGKGDSARTDFQRL